MKRSEKKRKRKILPWVIVIVLLLVGGVAGFGFMVYKDLTNTAKNIHTDLKRDKSDKRDEAINVKDLHPFSVLVLGVDERKDDAGRSDTMVVLTVNPQQKSTKLLSIPRDTLTEIVGKDFNDKINHAYAYGGIKMSLNTVEHFLDIPIDYVVQVNMESFKDIVDAVGGIDLKNEFAFSWGGKDFPVGKVHLNGEQALAYVRMRYEDPRGDFGRQDRQKNVIQAVLKKGASVNTLFNYGDIFKAIEKNVRTNLTFDEMVDIQNNYRDATKKIDQIYSGDGDGEMIDGVWYYIYDEQELTTIKNDLRKHLALPPVETTTDEEDEE